MPIAKCSKIWWNLKAVPLARCMNAIEVNPQRFHCKMSGEPIKSYGTPLQNKGKYIEIIRGPLQYVCASHEIIRGAYCKMY